jgi:hypothetical protein
MQAQLRHQKLQAAVLILHRLQPLRLADLDPAEPLLPASNILPFVFATYLA